MRMTEQKKSASPRIKRIVEPIITPGTQEFIKEGKPIKSGLPGTVLLIVGCGFGDDPDKAIVNFGDEGVDVFPRPLFTETQVFVSVPRMDPGATSISVTIAKARSNEVPFRVKRGPILKQPPGTLVKRLLSALDPLMVLLSAEIRIADFGRFSTKEFQEQLAEDVLEARSGIFAARAQLDRPAMISEDFMEIVGIELKHAGQLMRRIEERVIERSLRLFDQLIDSSQVLRQIDAAMERIRRGGKETATKALEIVAEVLNLVGDVAGAAESASDALNVSGSAEVVVGADIEGNPITALAALISGAAKGAADLGKIGATLSGNADADSQEDKEKEYRDKIEAKLDKLGSGVTENGEKLDYLESKSDKMEAKLDQASEKLDKSEAKEDVIESKLDKLEPKLDKLEEKADKAEEKLDKLEEKADKAEEKLDKLEEKADKAEEKLGKLEEKADKSEGKLDRLEEKADKAEEKLDKLEGKADKSESKLDRLEEKADKAEGKLDKLEEKADKAEGKLDKIEGKADKAESKLDAMERKDDRAEIKLDRLERKADGAEGKLDRLEQKADKSERKLDKLEQKADKSEGKLDKLEQKADKSEGKLDKLEQKADRAEGKLDKQEKKADKAESKLDRLEKKADKSESKLDKLEPKADKIEEKLDRPVLSRPLEGSVANQRGGADEITAAAVAIRRNDNAVYLRAAIDVAPSALDDVNAWSQWISFGRPAAAAVIIEVSIDLQYAEGSNNILNALLSVRDQAGSIFHRVFENRDHNLLLDPKQWSDWQDFLDQP
jgi:peptidoglycan hydrolase CwlO-like protein